ncbi:MAG: Mg2+ transporter protein, partial [Monoraphidium minutum]
QVLRVDALGQVRRVHARRRDLLREHGLQPRDLRRVDPSVDVAKTSPCIAVKEDVLLVNLMGVRWVAIVTADKTLFFEPSGVATRRLLNIVIPRLQASAGARLAAQQRALAAGGSASPAEAAAAAAEAAAADAAAGGGGAPFELEVLEGVLMVITGRLERQMTAMSQRVHALMTKLPRDINPLNLEELRRIKQDLVQLEDRADQVRIEYENRRLVRRLAPRFLPACRGPASHASVRCVAAQDALDELLDQEEEERELEEVEDLLEYYLQRASGTASEAERQLEGARDLEESIGVSLSARRYEVNRLELMLSMGSFAAALGAVAAGIFGMNMKSTLEFSVLGFWGVTAGIVAGCVWVFGVLLRYTQRKRIL